MARTPITPQQATATGTVIEFEPANVDGNSFPPARGRAVHIVNGSGGSVTVTVPTPATADGLAVADRAIVIAAGEHAVFAPGSAGRAGIYAQTDGAVHLDYSSATSVDVAVIDQP